MTGLSLRTDLRALTKLHGKLAAMDVEAARLRAVRSEVIYTLRERHGMTLDEIGAHLGVTRQAVHHWCAQADNDE